MSITSGSYSPKVYSCDGVQTQFDFDWRIFEEEDLVVKVWDSNGNPTTLSYGGGDFTVAKAGNDWKSGGTITTTETYASGYTLTIERSAARKQPADYIPNDSFPAETHESIVDRAVMIIQEFEDLLEDRSLIAPASDPTLDLELPTKDNRKSKYFYWDEDSKPTAAAQGLEGYIVTAFMETLLDDPNVQKAQETLEIIEAGEQISDFIKTLLNDSSASAARNTLNILDINANGHPYKIANDAQFENIRTRWYSVPLIGLVTQGTVTFGLGNISSNASNAVAILGVSLPHGVTVTQLDGWLFSQGNDDVQVRLMRESLSSGSNEWIMAQISHVGDIGLTKVTDSSIDYALIDNYQYDYGLRINFTGTTDNLMVAGILITYQITTLEDMG